jgi:hypothetical protein
MAETAPVPTATPPVQSKRGRPFKGQEKINVPEAMKLRLRGWTFDQLGDRYRCNKSAVISALDRLNDLVPNPEQREAYQQSKADILESVQLHMMSSLIDPAKIEKATLGNVAYAASKLDEMIRLERGQSTKNVNVLSMVIDNTHNKLFASSDASKQTIEASAQAAPDLRSESTNNGQAEKRDE